MNEPFLINEITHYKCYNIVVEVLSRSDDMSDLRGFEVVTKYQNQGIRIPKRATALSAGYDIEAAENITLPSIWQAILANQGVNEAYEGRPLPEANTTFLGSTLVPTGLKAYMPDDEYLLLANRSSNPMKRQLALPNGIGVIDADYYNNDKNEGEIFVQLINYGLEDVTIKKGERIAQGIFTPYRTIDETGTTFQKRTGGFGSSGL